MNAAKTLVPFDAGKEIPSLIETLLETERRLEELTGGEVDTVAGRDGKTFLLRRAQDNLRLREAARQTSILNALPANIALLDAQGLIVSVNEAWRQFARTNVLQSPAYGVGTNYLEVCESARGSNASEAYRVASGIRAVLSGEAGSFSIEYPCHAPREQRWFLLTVTPLADDFRNGAVVMHLNITARKLGEMASTRLAAVVESSQDAIIGKDLQGIVTSWNRGAEKIFGYTAAEMVGTSILKLNPTGRPDEHHHILEKIKRGENVGHFETLRQTKDRTLIHISVTASPIKDEGGAVIGISIVARDITQRQRTEAARQSSEARYRTMLQGITAGVVVHGANLQVIAFNPKATELLGVDAEQLRARTAPNAIWKRVRADGSPISDEELPYRRAHATRQPVRDVVLGLKRPTPGDFVWLLVNANPVLTPEGEVGEVIVTLLDVTARIQAEQAVQRQQIELRVLFDLMPAMIWFKDTENRILRVNQRVAEAVGKSVGELEGKPSAEIYPDEAANYFRDDLEVIHAGVPKLGIVEILRDLQGGKRWVQTDKVPVRDKDGNVTGIVVVARDITERKQAEDALREKDALIRIAGRLTHTGGWAVSMADQRVFWSDEICDLLECPRGNALQLADALAVHPDPSRDQVTAAMAACSRDGTPFDLEVETVTATGRRIWGRVCGEAERDADGSICRVQGAFQDITERKQAEATRLEREQEFEALVENAPDIVSRYDRKFRHLYVNRVVAQATGLPASAFIGKTHEEVGLPRHLQAKWHAVLEDVFASGKERETEFEFPTPGGPRFYQSRLVPEYAPDGRIRSVLNIARDITERKQAAEQLQQKNALIRIASRVTQTGGWVLEIPSEDLFWSDEVFDILEFPRGNVPAAAAVLALYTDQWRNQTVAALEACVKEGSSFDLEVEMLTAKKKRIWMRVCGEAVRREDGSVMRVQGAFQDISGRKQAEATLRESEERFRALAVELEMQKMRLIEAQAVAKVGSWETDAATLGVTWSDETYRIFEADPRNFAPTHERFLAFVHPDDRAEVDEVFRRSLDRASTFKLEHRILLPGGRVKFLEERWKTVFDESGMLMRISGTSQDITDRKRTEETLRLLSSAVEHSQESIVVTDANLELPGPKIIFVNPAYTKMTGYTAEESIGKTPRILQGPRTDKTVLRRLRQNLERGEEFSGVAINYRKDGTEFDLAWQIAPMRDDKGKTTHFVAIQRDVSERRRAEDALRKSEKRFKALFEQAAVGVSLADATTGRLVHVNQRFCEIVGRPREEVEQLRFAEITHRLDVGRDLEMLHQLKEGTIREYTREKRYLRKDLSEVWVTLTVSAMWAPGEAPDLCVAVVQDITGRKQLEEQFRQAQKMEAIGTLAGGIAHDFNNVLAAINGYTGLAKRELAGNAEGTEYLDAVLTATARATDLVRQILAFSRQQPPERKIISLGPVVQEALHLLRATIPTTIKFDISLAAESSNVLADATQVHQIVMNLCTNAAQAMKDGPGRLSVTMKNVVVNAEEAALQPGLRKGPHVRLTVGDTGQGIEEATLSRIFEPFFTTKAPGEGTGLGLAVVHGIMQTHEGAVTVSSRVGEGSTFRLYFPAHAGGSTTPINQAMDAPAGRGERILYIDDEVSLAMMGKKILERLGYLVDARTSAVDALATVCANPSAYDLVVTDQMMPGLMGTDLAEQLRAIRPGLPVILTSGYTATLTPERIKALGVRRLILKPLSVEALGSVVAAVLAEKTLPI